jgi:hypothetical protein
LDGTQKGDRLGSKFCKNCNFFSGVVTGEKTRLLLVFLRGLRKFVVKMGGKSLVDCGELRGGCGVLTPQF